MGWLVSRSGDQGEEQRHTWAMFRVQRVHGRDGRNTQPGQERIEGDNKIKTEEQREREKEKKERKNKREEERKEESD